MTERLEESLVAELPGVKKEDINLHASEDELIISVDTRNGNTIKSCHCQKKWIPSQLGPPTRMVSSRYDSKRKEKEEKRYAFSGPGGI